MNKFSITMNQKILSIILMSVMFLFISNISQATTLSFSNITNNSTIQLSDQLSVVVSEASSGVEFTLLNDVGIASSITDVYFDLGTNTDLFSNFTISDMSSGVSFDLAPHPENLPAGETINFYSDFGGDSTSPATLENGVNATGEYITFLASLGSGWLGYDNFINNIFDGDFRIGMHIQGIDGAGSEDSDSYVNAVPVPAAAWLFGTALLGFFTASKRRKN